MEKEVFQGLKVLDFSWVIASPWTVKYLADHGAMIIHVESIHHPDLIRMGPPFKDGKPGVDSSVYWVNYHCNAYGLSLNMNHPRAREIMTKLVSWADVIVENFAPGVMQRWGLSYEEVRQIKPDIIMLSSSQSGQTGPLATMPGTGVQLTAYSGFNHLTGWKDREPSVLYGGFTDCPAARFGTVILVAALLYRRRTGKGMYIDLSQYEAGLHLLAPVLMDYQVNGKIAMRKGNRHQFAAPHGVYSCRGDDSWCAVAVFTDEQWEGLCRSMGDPEWSKEIRFSTFSKRKENEDELDHLISEWTATLTAKEVMFMLQEARVPAGVVQKGEDLYNDPQLKQRGYFWEVDHRVAGKHLLESQAFQLPKAPRKLRMPSPCMGEHTEYVCHDVLKLSDEEFVELLVDGVFE
jgi:benzylsuccinate CoA-transferase BbsF subunit